MWIPWSPNLLVMCTCLTVKAAAQPVPSGLPKGSPAGPVTKLLAHSGSSNCVLCSHQPSTEGPAVISHDSFYIMKKRLFWPRETDGLAKTSDSQSDPEPTPFTALSWGRMEEEAYRNWDMDTWRHRRLGGTATDKPVQVSLWPRGTAPISEKGAEIATLLSAKP